MIQDRCRECGLRRSGFFCSLPKNELQDFESIKITKTYPKRGTLFFEGQPARGVHMLCQGKVKLSTCSPDGKMIILGIAEAGDVLGLSAAVNGLDYETTAEAMEPCQVNYVKTSDILNFLLAHPQAALNAVRQLSKNYRTAFQQICSLGLSESVPEKLAQLILGWSGNCNGNSGAVSVRNFFTHEQMAEMIGASRETVTRALKTFREQELISVKGSELLIHDCVRLKALAKRNGRKRAETNL